MGRSYWREDVTIDQSLDPAMRPTRDHWIGDDLRLYCQQFGGWWASSWQRPIGGTPGLMAIGSLPADVTLTRLDDEQAGAWICALYDDGRGA